MIRSVFKNTRNTPEKATIDEDSHTEETQQEENASKSPSTQMRNAIVRASLLRIPTRLDVNTETQLVNGTFSVMGKELNYHLDDGTHLLKARRAKSISREYTVFDMTGAKGPVEIATFSRAWYNSGAIAYRLAVGPTNVDVACVIFHQQRLVTKILEAPSRKIDLVISVTRNSGLPKSSTIVYDSQNIAKKKDELKKLDKPLQLVQVFTTKNPYNEKTGENVLWFNGRGKPSLCSSKNTQLVDSIDRIMWQMAQLSKTEYHVDFKAPLNPLQAFAVALGQYNL